MNKRRNEKNRTRGMEVKNKLTVIRGEVGEGNGGKKRKSLVKEQV